MSQSKKEIEMKYIKITNKVNNVNRLKLEKLGFSTKRDDVNTIGQFGSGIKFAPIAAIRRGIDFIFVGNDDKGGYTLEYIVKDEDGIPSIFYKYEDYEKSSSFTAEAGILSWESDFQIYREVVSNAIDQAVIDGTDWDMEVVDVEEITPVYGEFSVYLSATDELLEIHNNFDKYFCINREPIFTYDNKKIYEPIDDVFRVYSKGVLVFSSDKTFKSFNGEPVSGMFDYDLSNDIELNEERTVSNTFGMNASIVRLLSKAADSPIAGLLLDLCIKHDPMFGKSYYETLHISDYIWSNYVIKYGSNESLMTAFANNFGYSIIAPSSEATINFKQGCKARGYEVLPIDHSGLYFFMKGLGIPDYQSLFGEYFVYEVTKDLSLYPVVVNAMSIVNEIFPEFIDINDIIGIYHDDESKDVLAIKTTIPFEGEEEPSTKILINNHHAENAGIKSMIATFIHEWDHYRSNIGDGNEEGRRFRNLADETIGHLVYELWKTKKIAEKK